MVVFYRVTAQLYLFAGICKKPQAPAYLRTDPAIGIWMSRSVLAPNQERAHSPCRNPQPDEAPAAPSAAALIVRL